MVAIRFRSQTFGIKLKSQYYFDWKGKFFSENTDAANSECNRENFYTTKNDRDRNCVEIMMKNKINFLSSKIHWNFFVIASIVNLLHNNLIIYLNVASNSTFLNR